MLVLQSAKLQLQPQLDKYLRNLHYGVLLKKKTSILPVIALCKLARFLFSARMSVAISTDTDDDNGRVCAKRIFKLLLTGNNLTNTEPYLKCLDYQV